MQEKASLAVSFYMTCPAQMTFISTLKVRGEKKTVPIDTVF